VPSLTWKNFLFSNFAILPVLFLLLWGWRLAAGRGWRLDRLEGSLMAAIAAVFFFNNLAPPYDSFWQLRGEWIPRLYQPLFVVFLLFVAKLAAGADERWRPLPWPMRQVVLVLVAVAALADASVAFGPFLKARHAEALYYRFYQHSEPHALLWNMRRVGRRPLGFCRAQGS
jgi:hypothetical protein